MGFLNDLKASAKEGAEDIKRTVKIEEIKSDIRSLEKKETEAYAEIGREAIALDGPDKFGEKGAALMKLQSEIDSKKNELAALEKKPEGKSEEKGKEIPITRFCPQCGAELADDAKFCPKCGSAVEKK